MNGDSDSVGANAFCQGTSTNREIFEFRLITVPLLELHRHSPFESPPHRSPTSPQQPVNMNGMSIGPVDPRDFMRDFMATEKKIPRAKLSKVDFGCTGARTGNESNMAASFVSQIPLSIGTVQ